jgi:hypothetical protein
LFSFAAIIPILQIFFYFSNFALDEIKIAGWLIQGKLEFPCLKQ